jgi:acetyl esterase/lipase
MSWAPGNDVRAAEISPVFADLTGLLPVRIVVGAEDPLLDDSVACVSADDHRTGAAT